MEELLVRLKNEKSKEKAFKELIQQYQRSLYFHVRKYVNNHDDANDILQNTFIKVWKGIDNFRGDCSVYSWLYKIAGNEALTYISKNKKYIALEISSVDINSKISNNTDNAHTIEQKLEKALALLPEKQKQVFILRYYDEMPYEQMSEVLETSVGALKASYHHAVKKIEEIILSF